MSISELKKEKLCNAFLLTLFGTDTIEKGVLERPCRVQETNTA